MRVARPALAILLALVPLSGAADEPPTVAYVEAGGSAVLGLFGAGVHGVDLATILFEANGTYPKLQVLLDYAPNNLTIGDGTPSVALLYGFRLDLVDNATGMTVESFDFRQPGERHHTLNATQADGRTYRIDLVLEVGMDVEWTLRVYGWRGPIPI